MNSLMKRVKRLENEGNSAQHTFLFADRSESGGYVDSTGLEHATVDGFIKASGKDPEHTTVICWTTEGQ